MTCKRQFFEYPFRCVLFLGGHGFTRRGKIWRKLDVWMCTEFCPDQLRFAGIIPERLIFWIPELNMIG